MFPGPSGKWCMFPKAGLMNMFLLFWKCECFTCVTERMKAGRANDIEVLDIRVGSLGTASFMLLYLSIVVSHFAYYPQY